MLDSVDTLGDTSELVLAIRISGGRSNNLSVLVLQDHLDTLKRSIAGVVVGGVGKHCSTDGSLQQIRRLHTDTRCHRWSRRRRRAHRRSRTGLLVNEEVVGSRTVATADIHSDTVRVVAIAIRHINHVIRSDLLHGVLARQELVECKHTVVVRGGRTNKLVVGVIQLDSDVRHGTVANIVVINIFKDSSRDGTRRLVNKVDALLVLASTKRDSSLTVVRVIRIGHVEVVIGVRLLDSVRSLRHTRELVLAIRTSGGCSDDCTLVVQKSDGDSLKWGVTTIVVVGIGKNRSTDGSLE